MLETAGPMTEDFAAIGRIPIIPTIFETVCRLSGMRFVAVARHRGSLDRLRHPRAIAFGLAPGGELPVESTLCHEVRMATTPIVIDDIACDEVYRGHHTPATYGFRSYISVPIRRVDGSFFGTLCAIDPEPRRLRTPEIISLFEMFADLIGQHLGALERMAASEATLLDTQRVAALREQFIAVLSMTCATRWPQSTVECGCCARRP